MKNYHFLFICVCLILTSCGVTTPSYLGDKLPPTSSVDVFYSAHDVTKQYKVIGHLTAHSYGNDQDLIKSKFVDYAKTVGADAIVITGSTQVELNAQYGGSNVINADALKYTN